MNKVTVISAFIVLLFCGEIHATQATNIITFGDSLSDSGNNGRFTDGALWLEVLAKKLNLPIPLPSSSGGLNFAYSGAMSGYDDSSETVHVGNQIKADRKSVV